MIYIYNSEIEDMESFKEGLKEQYSVTSVTGVNWVKPRGEGAKAYVLTLQRESIPGFRRIVGEYSLTKVYEYNTKPLQCVMAKSMDILYHAVMRPNISVESAQRVTPHGSVTAII